MQKEAEKQTNELMSKDLAVKSEISQKVKAEATPVDYKDIIKNQTCEIESSDEEEDTIALNIKQTAIDDDQMDAIDPIDKTLEKDNADLLNITELILKNDKINNLSFDEKLELAD